MYLTIAFLFMRSRLMLFTFNLSCNSLLIFSSSWRDIYLLDLVFLTRGFLGLVVFLGFRFFGAFFTGFISTTRTFPKSEGESLIYYYVFYWYRTCILSNALPCCCSWGCTAPLTCEADTRVDERLALPELITTLSI